PAAARCRLGADDQREPHRHRDPALAGAAASRRDRPADRGHESHHRRDRSGGDWHRAERTMTGAAVVVEGLRVGLAGSPLAIVEEIDFEIAASEVLGPVGKAGSGKTTVGLALLGHCRRGAEITAGRIMIGDIEILRADPAALRAARGRIVAYVPQDPGTAL